MVDTSVVLAGVAGFKSPEIVAGNPSAIFIRMWAEKNNFIWLTTDEILDEYKEILNRRGVRAPVIGRIINTLREEAERIIATPSASISPDPYDEPFCALRRARACRFYCHLKSKTLPATSSGRTCDQPGRQDTDHPARKTLLNERLDGPLFLNSTPGCILAGWWISVEIRRITVTCPGVPWISG